MKDKLIYIVAFVLAFVLVTGGIVYLNNSFRNIFAFDFTPIDSKPEAPVEENSEQGEDQKDEKPEQVQDQKELIDPYEDRTAIYINTDSIKTAFQKNTVDSTKLKASRDSAAAVQQKSIALEDSIKNLKKQLKELALKNDEVKADSAREKIEAANNIQVSDSLYKSWIKKTVSLYETMDSRKAAKIILTYSDNIAKDIIYSMKKKKAAEILAQYSPEIVNRITRIK